MKRMASLLFALLLLAAALPLAAGAESGTCGANLTWTLTGSTLTVSGTGAMTNYSSTNKSPFPSGIYSVTLGSGVTSVGSYAFDGRSVTSVSFGGATTIGTCAFRSSAVKALTFPDSVTDIGMSAFEGCTSLKSIKLPSKLSGIRAYAFKNCVSLSDITWPTSLSAVGTGTFSGCSNLTTVDLPDSVKTLNENAFSNCSKLTLVRIPDGIYLINASAFSGCDSLEGLMGRDSGVLWSFCQAHGIELIPNVGVLKEGMSWRLSLDGCLTISGNGKMPDFYSVSDRPFPEAFVKTAVIESGVTSLSMRAFCDMPNLTQIAVPDTVARVEDFCFKNSGLTSIELPDSVQAIGMYAFEGCDKLAKVRLPEGLVELQTAAFRDCNHLSDIKLPASLESIGQYAFYDCTALETLDLPAGLTYIGTYSFQDSGVKQLVVPEAAYVSTNAFLNTDLTVYGVSGSSAETAAKSSEVSFVSIGGDCGPDAQWRLDWYTGVLTLRPAGKDVSAADRGRMDDYADVDKQPWSAVRGHINTATVENGIVNIGNYAFALCGLSKVNLPSSVKTIGSSAFIMNGSLSKIALPDGISDIGESAFGLTGLTEVYLPKSLTTVRKSTFALCGLLKYAEIPNGITAIESSAFSGANLLNQWLPPSLQSIGEKAFENNHKLAFVMLWPDCKEIGSTAFSGCENVRLCSPWDAYAHTYANSQGLPYIVNVPDTAWDLTLPSALTAIDAEAFVGVDARTIYIPDGVKTIGARAFGNCPNLELLYIPPDCTFTADILIGCPSGMAVTGYENAKQYALYASLKYIDIHNAMG